MQKKFISNLFLLLAINLLVKPFYLLGIETEVQNRVGAEVFGDFFALISFSFLLNIVLDMGISNLNTRTLSRKPTSIRKDFSRLFTIRIVLFVAYGILIFLVGSLLQYSPDQKKMLMILAVNQGLVALVLFLRSNLTGLHLFKSDSLISILDRIVLIVVLGLMLWSPIMGEKAFEIEWFIYSQTFAYGISALVALAMVLRKSGKLKLTWNLSETLGLLKKSAPYALLIFLMFLAFRTDSVMLERMLPEEGKEQAGIYAMGFRYFEAANQVAYLFAVLLLPLFARMLKKREDVTQLVHLSGKILLSVSVILALLCFKFDEELIALRYTGHTFEAAPIFGLLMFAFIAVSMSYVFGTLLTANGSLRALNWVAFGGFILNIVLNFIWIPVYHAWGSALATLITQGLMTVVQVVVAHKIIGLKISYKLNLRIVVFIIGCLIFSHYLTIIWENWLYNASIFLIACVLWAFITKVIDVKNFIKMIKT